MLGGHAARRPADGDRRRDAVPATPHRPEWIENDRRASSSRCSPPSASRVLLGSVHHRRVRRETRSWCTPRSCRVLVRRPERLRLRARERRPADLLGARGVGVLQGRHVQHRRRGPVHRRHGVGLVRGADLTSCPAPLLVLAVLSFGMLGGMVWAAVPAILKVKTGRPRGRHDDHDERHRGELRRVGDPRPPAVRGHRRGFNVNLRTDPFPDAAIDPRSRRTCSASRVERPAVVGAAAGAGRRGASSGSCCGACDWATRRGQSAPRPGSARAGGISIGAVQIKLFLISGALAGLVGIQQLFADQGFLRPATRPARVHRHRGRVPRAEQPDRHRLRGARSGACWPGARSLAAARDRRAARVHHHPAGISDHLGRGDLPAGEATVVRAAAPPSRGGRGPAGRGGDRRHRGRRAEEDR